MPCDTIQTTAVEFLASSTDVKLLKRGMERLGYSVTTTSDGLSFSRWDHSGTYNKTTGKMDSRGRGSNIDIDEVKRAYSREIVHETAREEGWQVSWTVNAAGNEVYTVEKAAY